ncbi:MAG: U32 family peptidase, partial [Treponema sp.]|nr:U32 family peptidase [Treponema sp.]
IAGAGDTSSGGYYFSPHDLQLLPHLPDLAAASINALKIEGRMKSADYVGTVVSAYRMVIDAVSEGNEEKISQSIASGLEILRSDFARPKTSYFFLASGGTAPAIDWLNPGQDGGTGIFLGSIRKTENLDSEKIALVDGSGAAYVPRPGDTVRLHRSDDSGRVTHKLVYAEKVKSPAASGSAFRISVPDDVSPGDRVNLIQVKSMSRRYKPVITRIGSGRGPGREKAPVPEIFRNESSASVNSGTGSGKSAKKAAFPEGLYVAVSRIEDLYILQSSRPIRVMLSFNAKTRPYLVSDAGQPGLQKPGLIKPGFIKPLPFRPAEMILVLDPFYPQADSDAMADSIGQLVKRGYRQFVVNNPGHFSLFRDYSGCELIAGPWLYIFNRWAFSFIASHGIGGFISPYENNRQNLERTAVSGMERSRFFVPVFARPPLFHIRSNLGAFYNFSSFSDSRDAQFTLDCGPDGSVVASDIPFSIADKTPFLKEAGFRRFIIDLGGITIRKSDYRDLMYAAANGIPLPHTSRFNWKDGFFVGE